jgi:hypothetical protein
MTVLSVRGDLTMQVQVELHPWVWAMLSRAAEREHAPIGRLLSEVLAERFAESDQEQELVAEFQRTHDEARQHRRRLISDL